MFNEEKKRHSVLYDSVYRTCTTYHSDDDDACFGLGEFSFLNPGLSSKELPMLSADVVRTHPTRPHVSWTFSFN